MCCCMCVYCGLRAPMVYEDPMCIGYNMEYDTSCFPVIQKFNNILNGGVFFFLFIKKMQKLSCKGRFRWCRGENTVCTVGKPLHLWS